MKNRIFTCLFLSAGSLALAQVGINTPNPQATLDVVAKNATGTAKTAEGLLIPRVDRQRAQSMTGVITSTLIYVNNIATGTAAGTAINITSTGYYYFDDSVWVKVNSGPIRDNNIYTTNGSLTGNRIVTQGKNTLAFSSDAVNGFSVDGITFSVDAVNNRVGIGTAAPNSDLQVLGNEMRLSGPASQTGSVPNPVFRIHSNANTDGSGGELRFSENDLNYGYYIRHNTEAGAKYGYDGLAIGSAGGSKYAYNPARPGVFVADNQNIGFGTATPQQMFHIDGARDNNINSAPTAAQLANDLVINGKGFVGIGITSPDKKLDIQSGSAGAVRIQDGTQGNGYVFTSTADGTGTWKQPRAQVVRGTTTGGYDFPFTTISGYRYTGASITLPPGKWLVTISQLIYPQGANLTVNDWMFVRSTFSDQNLTTVGQVGVQSADVNDMPTLMSFQVSGPYTQGQLRLDVKTGSVYINNASAGNKTYRYIAGGTAIGGNVAGAYLKGLGGGWAENSIVATAIN